MGRPEPPERAITDTNSADGTTAKRRRAPNGTHACRDRGSRNAQPLEGFGAAIMHSNLAVLFQAAFRRSLIGRPEFQDSNTNRQTPIACREVRRF